MNTRCSFVCMGLVFLALALGPGAQGGDLEVLTTTPDQDAEPAIAVSPFNPCDAVAVWFTQDSPHTGWFASTRDGWETKHIGEFDFDEEYNPVDFSVVYDRFNSVFWASYFALGDGLVYAKSSIDSGNIVFAADTDDEVLLDEGSGGFHATDKPWITMGRRPGLVSESNLYVVYTDLEDEIKIYLRRSVNDSCDPPDTNGRCWESRQFVGVKGLGALPLVSPTAPEILYIAYWLHPGADTEDEDEWIKIVKSVNTGASFGTAVEVHDLVDTRRLFGDGELKLCIPGEARQIVKFPSIVARRSSAISEKVFVVWADVDLDSSGCSNTCEAGTTADVDIYFARLASPTTNTTMSMDSGFPKKIVSDPSGPGAYTCADQFFPWMTIDGDDTLHVVYFDNGQTPDADDPPLLCSNSTANQRDDDSCAMTYDLYYTFSTDDGDTWSTPERITTVGEGGSTFIARDIGLPYFIGDYIGVSASLDPDEPAVNAAFNRDLDLGGNPLKQEVYVGKIETADCGP